MLCLKCSTELDENGVCAKGCTEEPDYGVMQGLDMDQKDIMIKSAATGICQVCGEKVNCPNGCHDPSLYTDDTRSNIALEKGVCLVCGKEVKCPNECF